MCCIGEVVPVRDMVTSRLTADKSSIANQHAQDLLCQLRSVRDVCRSPGATPTTHFRKSVVGDVTGSPVASVAVLVFVLTQAGVVAFAEIACHNKSIPRGRPAWCLSDFGPWLINLLDNFLRRRFYW